MKIKQYKKETSPKNILQPYSFTRQLLSFDFNITEMRILFRIFGMIKSVQKLPNSGYQIDIEQNVTLLFPVSAFMLPGHKNHNDIRQAAKSLREKTVERAVKMEVEIDGIIEQLDADEFFGVIESFTYAHNNSFMSLKVKEAWFRYLSDVSGGYTTYLANVAFNCSSTETVKMYMFINHWFKSKGKTLKMANFRTEFNIPDSYNISKIVSRILDPCRAELDSIADRSFNYTLYLANGEKRDPNNPKKGFRVDKIIFTFYTNHKNKSFYELSDHEHIEVQKWLKRITKRYSLETGTEQILYASVQRY